MDRFLRKIDQFRTLPSELKEANAMGGTFSIFAFVVLAFLLLSELWDFISTQEYTNITMNPVQSDTLWIHFDVTLFQLPCEHTSTIVYDTFRETELEITSSTIKKTPIEEGKKVDWTKSKTTTKGKDDVIPLVDKTEKHPELDQDWDVSSVIMSQHIEFKDVIKKHDFTFVNFYADWCSHCKKFAPTWNAAEAEADTFKDQFKDADGQSLVVKMIRVNCVDFKNVCSDQNIRYYPNVRLYKSDATYTQYEGKREQAPLINFLKTELGKSHHEGYENMDKANERNSGCRISGSIQTKRVPGEFHFQVGGEEDSLVPSMTNVSHHIHHLVFADLTNEQWNAHSRRLSRELLRGVNPLHEKSFVSSKSHFSPQHFLQVVATEVQGQLVYQTTAQSHFKPEDRSAVPQAKFAYTISPMTVKVRYARKPLYQFFTSLCAMCGGAFTLIKVMYGTAVFINERYKRSVGRLG